MYLTALAVSLYLGLLIVNFLLASVSYHVKAIKPFWALAHILNKMASILIMPAILIDLIRFIL